MSANVLVFVVIALVVMVHAQIRDDYGNIITSARTRHQFLTHHRDHSHTSNWGRNGRHHDGPLHRGHERSRSHSVGHHERRSSQPTFDFQGGGDGGGEEGFDDY